MKINFLGIAALLLSTIAALSVMANAPENGVVFALIAITYAILNNSGDRYGY